MKEKVKIIENCPSCGAALERVTDQLFCRSNSCTATQGKKVLHFAKTMKIKGLGEKTLEKLELETIRDIYCLSKETLIDVLGDKIGTKLFNEIEFSKVTTIEKILPAFSIPLIGSTAARKVYAVRDKLEFISFDICKTAGLGDKASDNLANWLIDNYSVYKDLPLTYLGRANTPITKSANIKICITGKLDDYSSRSLATTFLEGKGITVVSSVTKTLDYLINEDNKPSSKLSKANSYTIPVVTIKQLIEEIIND